MALSMEVSRHRHWYNRIVDAIRTFETEAAENDGGGDDTSVGGVFSSDVISIIASFLTRPDVVFDPARGGIDAAEVVIRYPNVAPNYGSGRPPGGLRRHLRCWYSPLPVGVCCTRWTVTIDESRCTLFNPVRAGVKDPEYGWRDYGAAVLVGIAHITPDSDCMREFDQPKISAEKDHLIERFPAPPSLVGIKPLLKSAVDDPPLPARHSGRGGDFIPEYREIVMQGTVPGTQHRHRCISGNWLPLKAAQYDALSGGGFLASQERVSTVTVSVNLADLTVSFSFGSGEPVVIAEAHEIYNPQHPNSLNPIHLALYHPVVWAPDDTVVTVRCSPHHSVDD